MSHTKITQINKEVLIALLESEEECYISIAFPSESELVLHKSVCHFVGFKPATVIQLYCAEKVDTDEYHVVNSEYFSYDQTETAVEAFAIRHTKGGYDVSEISDSISDFLQSE